MKTFSLKTSKALFVATILTGVVALTTYNRFSRAGEEAKAADNRVYELRTYVAAPGKMEALHARFRDHTNKLFVKHGMTAIGYWTPTDGEGAADTLIYLLSHSSRDAAKKSWMAFGSDPEWNKARSESEKDGKLTTKVESRFLTPTDYSALK